ncbi:MAG: repeat-associated core domain protein [Bacteroidota bacterium]|nr:repeat-associated core domain protein [Bacteroidota bacterium]
MENKSSNNSTSSFFKTDGGKTTSNAIEVPSISLPKGGGAIKSIDEKFQMNPVNGTAGFSISFPFSKSRNDFMPGMTLAYNSGSGNGIFGLGWSAETPSIFRKTEKKLPQYNDLDDSDTFVFAGAEDLVAALMKDTDGEWIKDESTDGLIKRYRPRIESSFARIEKITETTGNVYWKVTSKDNIISVFGKSKSAQVYDLDDPSKVFKWMLEFSCDDKGNCIQYEYKKEDKTNISDNLFESNRINDFSRFTNTYLKSIKYCNKTHFNRNAIDFNTLENIPEADYFLELVLDYGEHDIRNPQPDDDKGWLCRPDAFSEYRAGFEIRTYRLCSRLLMFHHFTELSVQPYLVCSTNFEYNSGSAFTFLKSIQQKSYEKKVDTDVYAERALPPVEFSYEALGWDTDVKSLTAENLGNLPVGIDDKLYQWVDLYGEGISGILTEQADALYYKNNNGNGDLGPQKLVSLKPSFRGLNTGAVHLQDVEANGQKFLVSDDLNGYFEFSTEDEWLPFRNFNKIPNVDVRDSNVKFLDLNGDGKADILISEENVFVWYASKGKEGFENSKTVFKTFDEEKGPDIVFADSTQSIVLADMSGDGLMDIVRIRNRNIAYWPNLGYGKFGAKVNMGNAPLFDTTDQFNANYIKLADLDGSGIPDIVYLGNNSFKIYFNQSGNSWSEENNIRGVNPLPFPKIDNHANINIVDLLGNGTGCIIWSSPLPVHAQDPLRYIDLMGGKKPHVMTSYKNNMGKEVFIEYKSSTQYYLEDKKAGTPWITKLPFPVQCVSKTIQKDKWRKTQFSNQFFYHHGYYDYTEREFRGFGCVEQIDTETFGEFANENNNSPYITQDKLLYQPPVMTRSWFHTGAFIDKEKILSQFEQEYFKHPSGLFIENKLPEPDIDGLGLTLLEYKEALRSCKSMPLRQEIYVLDVDELDKGNFKAVKLFSAAYQNCHIKLLQPQKDNLHAVFLTTESEAITYNYELDLTNSAEKPDPRILHTLNLKSDEYGNVLKSISIVYSRIGKHTDNTLPPGAEELIAGVQQKRHISYMETKFTNDIINETDYRLRLPCEVQTSELTGIPPVRGFYFSLKELVETTENKIQEIAYHRLPDKTLLQKRTIECVRIIYFNDDALINALPFGEIKALALPYETYKLALTKELLNEILGEKLMELQEDSESSGAMLSRVLTKSGYHFENNQWWIRSGIAGFSNNAAEHFYLPEKYTDPFDNVATLQFDEHDLYVRSSEDALGNHTEVTKFDFRVLAPQEMKDINDNLTEVKFDILGMPAAMALKGKGMEGDDVLNVMIETDAGVISFFTNDVYHEQKAKMFLGNATARYVYSLGEQTAADGTITYEKHPACAVAIAREKHVAQLTSGETSPVQVSFQYSDGSGTVIASKEQAEPDNNSNEIRWITNGKTILNNKGKPVKQYEPYFTTNHNYEEPVEIGVTSVIYYDAAGRVIRSEMPDGTYSRVEFTPWYSKVFDQNDTVSESGNEWYGNNNSDSAERAKKNAASQTVVHADTPTQTFFDALGRDVITVTHNKWVTKDESGIAIPHDEKYFTYTKLDAEGKPLWIQDPRGNKVMQYIVPPLPAGVSEEDETQNYFPAYDIAGNLLFQHSMDNGNKWMMTDAAGKPYYSWDENERQDEENRFLLEKIMYTLEYDGLHRPTNSWLSINRESGQLIEQVVYGENKTEEERSDKQLNLRGQIYQHFDAAGIITNKHFDFKGNLLSTKKQIAADYKSPFIDWQQGFATNNTEPETFLQQTEYDALNRMTRLYNWYKIKEDGSSEVAVYEPKYNRRGILESEELIVKANKTAEVYSNGTRTTAVSNISYDAKGQLQSISYANGTKTQYYYDDKTFRLMQLRTTRKNVDPIFPHASGLKDPRILQNLFYTYDAVGNITEIYDDAYEPAFFNNQEIEPRSAYVYDALYRLILATGRENNTFDTAPQQSENAAAAWESMPQTDSSALRNYTQFYTYDPVGNILQLKHIAGRGNQTHRWTRTYKYAEDSNRLLSTETGGTTINYNYDTHGSIRNLANVGDEAFMQWDYRDMIQSLDCIGGGKVYYQYDNGKQRSRKVIEKTGSIKEERWYLGGMEWYRKTIGNEVVEEIETHHLFVGEQRILIVEDVIKTNNTLLSAGVLYRYQYNNHLGSVGLEADETGNIISYEEYHPYGTPAYTAKNKNISSTAKRYRYTAMERDEESGLNYHTARYYAPWLGRWCSSDPIGIEGGINFYQYVNSTPINNIDPSGTIVPILVLGVIALVAILANPAPVASHARALTREESQSQRDRTNQAWANTAFDAGAMALGGRLPVRTTLSGRMLQGAAFGGSAMVVRRGVHDVIQGETSPLSEYATDFTLGSAFGAGGELLAAGVGAGARRLSPALRLERARAWVTSTQARVNRLTERLSSLTGAASVRLSSLLTRAQEQLRRATNWLSRTQSSRRGLSLEERRALQDIANKFKTEIDVVGSRAADTGRNVGSNLPVGKGQGTKSDIDVRINSQLDINTGGRLSEALKNIKPEGLVDVRSRIGVSRSPTIIIKPKNNI